MLMNLEKVRQDKVWEFHKHYNSLKFVKPSIYRPRIFDVLLWFFFSLGAFDVNSGKTWLFWWSHLGSECFWIRLETFGTDQTSLLLHIHLKNQLFFVKLWKPALFSLGHQLLLPSLNFVRGYFCPWGHTWGCQLASESIRFCIELFGTVQTSYNCLKFVKSSIYWRSKFA